MSQKFKRIIEEINELKKTGSKVVFVSGNFNIVHPGHLRLLRYAKGLAEILVVGVYSDSLKFGAFIKENHRLEVIEATSWVDVSFILDEKPEAFIKELKPDFVVKGTEHEERVNPEAEVLKTYGGTLIFSSGDIVFSSKDLLEAEFNKVSSDVIKKPLEYLKRHNISLIDLKEYVEKFKSLKVLVIGETIIDEYIDCEALGMSQEEPVIAVMPDFRKKFLGGAAIVASHARGLGAEVDFFSVLGKDDGYEYTVEELKNYGVNHFLFKDETRPSIIKQRFRVDEKTLLKVSNLRQHPISKSIQKEILSQLVNRLEGKNVIVFADFNYGMLPQFMVDRIIRECQKRNIMIAADSQASSQIGDVSRYKHAALLCPTEREARLALNDYDSGLVVLCEKLRNRSKGQNILLTLGREGLLIHAAHKKDGWLTDRLPAFNKVPKDIAGAGDSLFISAALSLCVDNNIWKAAYIGSLAAGIQISRLGNIPIKLENFTEELMK